MMILCFPLIISFLKVSRKLNKKMHCFYNIICILYIYFYILY